MKLLGKLTGIMFNMLMLKTTPNPMPDPMPNIEETPQKLSAILQHSKNRLTGDKTTLSDLLSLFGARGTAFILFLVALPAALPVPAIGIFMLIAPPLIFLTIQQMMGRSVIWLPEWLKSKSMETQALKDIFDKAIPLIEKIEFLSRPRLRFLSTPAAQKVIGILGFIMALSVMVPVPLTNTVPSFGIALMSFGVLMRDGLAVMAGALIGLGWVFMLVTVTLFFGAEAVDIIKEFIKSWM